MGKDFDEAHVKLVQNMVMACNNQNVKEIIHVSALGVSDSAPSEYLRSKYAAEKFSRSSKAIQSYCVLRLYLDQEIHL